MKILNAIHAQAIGGVNQVFCDYSKALEILGHEVALVISANRSNQTSNQAVYNCNYSHLKVKKIYQLNNISPILDFLKLLQIVIVFKPDVMFCHSPRIAAIGKYLKWFTKTKIIAINHGTNVKRSLSCHFAISVNENLHQALIKKGFDAKRSFVVPNAIEVTKSYQDRNIQNPIVIASYGRLEKAKGFDILLRAAHLLLQEDFDFRIKIGGFEANSNYGWQDVKDLANQLGVAHKCDFVGIVSNKEEFFKDVDIFCSASRQESFGLGILEAFLHSSLVITSKTDGGKFLVKEKANGLLFEIANHQQLAEKIIWVVQNKEMAKILIRTAFFGLEAEFGLNALQRNLQEVLGCID